MNVGRKKVLVLNVYFPEIREPVALPNEVPQPLAPILLAGACSDWCDVQIYSEVSAGFIEYHRPDLLEWADMIVLSGLTTTFDRMLHVTAYTRTTNPDCIIVAGGIAARAFRHYARQFFDYVCVGDVEELRGVLADAWGPAYARDTIEPRYDLADYVGGRIGYVESSRNCNFRCSFCSLTSDGYKYEKTSIDHLRRQIEAIGSCTLLHFNDNQFHPNDKVFFQERMDLLRDMRARGHFKYWSGFVTNTFFWSREDMKQARETGCFSLFVGVESFNDLWLKSMNKTQNIKHSQLELIEHACDEGILFQYGLVFDPSERTLADMHRELDIICNTPTVPAPNFIFMAIPLPGTPFFHDRANRGMLLPNTKARDLEGSTLSMKTVDDVEQVAEFVRTAKNFKGYARRLITHQARFLWRYRDRFNWLQSVASSLCMTSILTPTFVSNPRYAFRKNRPRTHISTTERLDDVYTPNRRVDTAYEGYFSPTMITDESGELNNALIDDLMATRFQQRSSVAGG